MLLKLFVTLRHNICSMNNIKVEKGKCYIDGVEVEGPYTKEVIDELVNMMWDDLMEMEVQRQAEWDALPEEEKKRIEEQYSDPFYLGFYERISDDPLGYDD